MNGSLNKKIKCLYKDKHAISFATFISLFLLIIACPITNSLAKNWYVDPWDPNKGIQEVIDNAFFGDTVLVPGGFYPIESEIQLKEGITLAGIEEDLGAVVISGKSNQSIIRAHSHTCIKNLVIRGGDIGIICDNDMKNIIISHNLIVKNNYGVKLSKSDNVKILGNTIAHNKINGVKVEIDPYLSKDSNQIILYGQENIIGFNGRDIQFSFIIDQNSQEDPCCELKNIFLLYNDLYDRVFQVLENSSNIELASNKILFLEPFGPGNFFADPYFIDTNNYSLLSYSPCIDRGDPNSDYSSEPVPNGGRINLGFYGNTPQAAESIDSDSDGLYDSHEGTGDSDGDGFPDWQDADTAIIPLPWETTQKISIHLQDSGPDSNRSLQLKDTKIVLLSELAMDPPQGILPFDAIQFSVPDLDEGAVILIRMLFPEDFGALGTSQYLALSVDTQWEPLPFAIDQIEKAITFKIEDGHIGDKDGEKNGAIEHLACLIIPQQISGETPGSCFVSLCNPVSLGLPHSNPPGNYLTKSHHIRHINDRESALLFFFCILPALFFICCLAKLFEKRWLFAFFIFILVVLSFSHGWAQREDINFTSPNPVGSGARALGMGGAFIGVSDDATAASWNPAGLKHLVRPEISLVEAYSSRKESYRFEKTPESSGEYRLSGWDVNYLSLAFPARFFRKNFVFSLNYQYLYNFSKRLSSFCWHFYSESPYRDIKYQVSYEELGALKALSPAMAVMLTPRLSLGLTVNIWSDKLFNNEWIERYHRDGQGLKDDDHKPVVEHLDVIEKYSFSGLNFNLGLLWDIGETFTLGVVYKTPFKADLEHTRINYKIEEYPRDASLNIYEYHIRKTQKRLYIPRSYGLGLVYHPIDALIIDLDIYRTEWGDYELIEADGSRKNPIIGYESETKVRPTHQVRLGAEYAFVSTKGPIPTIRAGTFYDPKPAANKVDDFYGVSLGFGMTFREKNKIRSRRKRKKERRDFMSIDMAYQYRWGRQVEGFTVEKEISPGEVDHHMIYCSVIYYI